MSGTMTFHSLIEALAGAVIEAQDSIEMHQLSNLRDFFDEDNRPRSVTIVGPSMMLLRRRAMTSFSISSGFASSSANRVMTWASALLPVRVYATPCRRARASMKARSPVCGTSTISRVGTPRG